MIDQGAPGRGKKILPTPDPGHLYGWKHTMSAARRHLILVKAVRKDGYATIIRRLNLLRNFTHRTSPSTARAAGADMAWLKAKYRPAGYKPKVKPTARRRAANPHSPTALPHGIFRRGAKWFIPSVNLKKVPQSCLSRVNGQQYVRICLRGEYILLPVTTFKGRARDTNPLLMSVVLNPGPRSKKKSRRIRRQNPGKSPWRNGQEVPVDQVIDWIRRKGSPAQIRQMEKAWGKYTEFHKGSTPATVIIQQIPGMAQGQHLQEFVAGVGISPTETYISPPGSGKGKAAYLHEWGDGDESKMPHSFVTSDGMFVGKALRGGSQKVDEWMEG